MDTISIDKKIKPLVISSPAFSPGGIIPEKYTCEGVNISPPLTIADLPKEVKSIALIVDDPDAPHGTWVHWLMWNIPPTDRIKEDDVPGVEGTNNFGEHGYRGPCPPSGTHRYFFRVYGLDDLLNLKEGAARKDLEHAMQDHILAGGELRGVFEKKG